ncbi:MAG: ATP-grasp domain-containing protein [Halomonas sp.]|nr:ATP-grasp domain-containing protein [Halomonas sp.]TVP49258.1 MAG: ATP-grasp domain-containing protein [Halomonas sp.]
MNNNYMVVVDPYSSGALYADVLREHDIHPIAVLSSKVPPEVYSKSFNPDDFDIVFIYDSHSEDELICSLKKFDPVAVITGCESGVKVAELIAPKIIPERSNPPELAIARWHKGEMYKAVKKENLTTMRQICSNSISEIKKWISLENLEGEDLIIKPPASASTDSVTLVKNGENWEKVFNDLINVDNRLGIKNSNLMVQEFLKGQEYAVDVISYEGRHSICSICLYNKIEINGIIGIYESLQWLSSDFDDFEVVTEYSFDVLNALGVVYGVSHIEVMMTINGPRLIEIGARPHGGGHPKYCKKAVGDNQLDRMVKSYIKGELVDKKYALKSQMKVVFFICEKKCYVSGLNKLNDIKKLDSFFEMCINIKEGDMIAATSDLFSSLSLGFVVLLHSDLEVINKDCIAVRAIEKNIYISKSFNRSV